MSCKPLPGQRELLLALFDEAKRFIEHGEAAVRLQRIGQQTFMDLCDGSADPADARTAASEWRTRSERMQVTPFPSVTLLPGYLRDDVKREALAGTLVYLRRTEVRAALRRSGVPTFAYDRLCVATDRHHPHPLLPLVSDARRVYREVAAKLERGGAPSAVCDTGAARPNHGPVQSRGCDMPCKPLPESREVLAAIL